MPQQKRETVKINVPGKGTMNLKLSPSEKRKIDEALKTLRYAEYYSQLPESLSGFLDRASKLGKVENIDLPKVHSTEIGNVMWEQGFPAFQKLFRILSWAISGEAKYVTKESFIHADHYEMIAWAELPKDKTDTE